MRQRRMWHRRRRLLLDHMHRLLLLLMLRQRTRRHLLRRWQYLAVGVRMVQREKVAHEHVEVAERRRSLHGADAAVGQKLSDVDVEHKHGVLEPHLVAPVCVPIVVLLSFGRV